MPLFTLKSYHHTACTVGSGMKRARERETKREGEGEREGEGDVESCLPLPPYLFFCIQFPERERTSEYTFEILSRSSCTSRILPPLSRHSRKQRGKAKKREPRNNQPCLSFCSTEGSYNETHSSIVESLIIHCGSFAGEPYHITI